MKKRLVALCLLTATVGFADDDTERAPPPPEENLVFDTDIELYLPKFTLTYGERLLTGAKATYSGSGTIADLVQNPGNTTDPTVNRVYHDGSVAPDARSLLVDNGNGGTTSVPITPDGQTNQWSFSNQSQVNSDGTVSMNAYTAQTLNSAPIERAQNTSFGEEVALAYDIGKIGSKVSWSMLFGLSVNNISSKFDTIEPSAVTTVTDTYSLNGGPTPIAPYNSVQGTSITATDASGNPILNSDGTTQVTTINAGQLLSQLPIDRTTTTTIDTADITSHYEIKGAYYTFRLGPTFSLPLFSKMRLSFSAGGAMAFAGTTFTVDQQYTPPTGQSLDAYVYDVRNKWLKGYFADANIEYWLSGRTGFYFGAIYQNLGSYTQIIDAQLNADTAYYVAKIDLSSLQGFRMGVNYRF